MRERIPFDGDAPDYRRAASQQPGQRGLGELTREVDAEALVLARTSLRERLGAPLSYDSLFVKLFGLALRAHGELNARIEDNAILVLDEIHVGFAVDAPNGLVVPVVRDADARPLAEIAASMRGHERARARQYAPAGE